MIIYGIDFTSAPKRKKSIACAYCCLEADGLYFQHLEEFHSFCEFKRFLDRLGPWIAGLDFPFGQPRELVEALGWPQDWSGYVEAVAEMTKDEFVTRLAGFRASRPPGRKQPPRDTDRMAGSRSAMMLYGVPVGKMFFEGAKRLHRSGACILPCRPNDDPRILIEAYPALVVRKWVGRCSYKSDASSKKKDCGLKRARVEIIRNLHSAEAAAYYGFAVNLPDPAANVMIDDGSGDRLDALLCAIQAAWAYTQRDRSFGILAGHELEGWIVDPGMWE